MIPGRSVTTLLGLFPGVDRAVCLPNIQAVHLGVVVSLPTDSCSFFLLVVQARTPVRIRNLTLANDKCPSFWCQRSNSFSASDRFMFSLLTSVMVVLKAIAAFWTPFNR